jgi:hypothetical protein
MLGSVFSRRYATAVGQFIHTVAATFCLSESLARKVKAVFRTAVQIFQKLRYAQSYRRYMNYGKYRLMKRTKVKNRRVKFPLIRAKGRKKRKKLDVPSDVAFVVELQDDLRRYAASLR